MSTPSTVIRPRVGLVEAEQEADDGGLPRPGVPDERHRLARAAP